MELNGDKRWRASCDLFSRSHFLWPTQNFGEEQKSQLVDLKGSQITPVKWSSATVQKTLYSSVTDGWQTIKRLNVFGRRVIRQLDSTIVPLIILHVHKVSCEYVVFHFASYQYEKYLNKYVPSIILDAVDNYFFLVKLNNCG